MTASAHCAEWVLVRVFLAVSRIKGIFFKTYWIIWKVNQFVWSFSKFTSMYRSIESLSQLPGGM